MGSPTSRLERLVASLAARDPITVDDPARRQAAVALILVPDPDRLLLVRRVVREGDPWSGQLALPGGRRESGDADLLGAAVADGAAGQFITAQIFPLQHLQGFHRISGTSITDDGGNAFRN